MGEALLNDGVAIVLFGVLVDLSYRTSFEIAVYLVKVVFFSPLLGIALGLGERGRKRGRNGGRKGGSDVESKGIFYDIMRPRRRDRILTLNCATHLNIPHV